MTFSECPTERNSSSSCTIPSGYKSLVMMALPRQAVLYPLTDLVHLYGPFLFSLFFLSSYRCLPLAWFSASNILQILNYFAAWFWCSTTVLFSFLPIHNFFFPLFCLGFWTSEKCEVFTTLDNSLWFFCVYYFNGQD